MTPPKDIGSWPDLPRLVRPWSEVVDESLDLWQRGFTRGDSTGWPAVDPVFTLQPNEGQLTVVTGVPGSGKSEWLDALAINLAQSHGWRWAVYSPENHPVSHHIAKLAEKIARLPFHDGPSARMSKEQFTDTLPFLRDHFEFLDPEYQDPEFLSAAAMAQKGSRSRFGVIIDPWNTLEHKRHRDETETEYVGRILTHLVNESRAFRAHVFLVAHPQKMQRQKDGKYPVPGPWDISGSAHFFNKPDNIICVHRDKADPSSPVEIHVQKIRRKTTGSLGVALLRYDRITGRYYDVPPDPDRRNYANKGEG